MASKPENPAQAAPQKTLKQFYREIQRWIDDGCPDHEIFHERWALCRAAFKWGDDPAVGKIKQSFRGAMLAVDYPFNEGWADFNNERLCYTLYKNPARLAWIKEHSK